MSDSRKVWKVRLLVAVLLVLALTLLGFWFRGHVLSAWGLIVAETGGPTAAVLSITLALFILLSAFLWMIFPLLVYFGLKDLKHRIAGLDQTMQISAQHLARLAARPENSGSGNTPPGLPRP